MGDFTKLVAWQVSHALAGDIFDALEKRRARTYPRLRDQLLRSAGSVPDCIAEGNALPSPLEYKRYMRAAYASAKEMQSQLMRARRVRIITPAQYDDFAPRADRAAKLCYGLMNRDF